jgi:outer membrane lipoprotein LolB
MFGPPFASSFGRRKPMNETRPALVARTSRRLGLRERWCVAIGLLALILSGCTTLPEESPPAPDAAVDVAPTPSEAERWATHREAVLAMADWEARGKVAYRLPEDSGSANLTWQQQGEDSELRLSGPLGAGATTIRNDGPLIRVARDGIERLYPADAAPWLPGGDLLPIPVEAIRHWIRGVPDPGLPVDTLTLQNARAATLAQGGWLIWFDAYDESVQPPLPSRLRIEAPVAKLSLRALIREWE